MKIVEYSAKYAAQIADMWNKSGENWGNDTNIKTAEDILQEESASGNIKLYLAIDNNEVVGYCSFSEYRGDEGASYLPLLNVRPDYHGKKVGKQLILTVLEDAIKSKWSRFDLYTWSGNIKAMPLYKKCGFFWEKKNNTVHLMNFIPYVYQTELLDQYMEKIDWYKDSKRIVDMNQDGDLRGEFDIYTYEFSNSETSLLLEFERKGRGLTLIQTPEFKIELKMKNQDLVFGQSYEVEFEVVSNTKEPIDLKILGKNNKNINFDFEFEGKVTDQVIKSLVYVDKIEKEQDEGKTHPVVEADVYVNGKLATFKLGLNPKFPIQTKLRTDDTAKRISRDEVCYLEVENNFTERKDVSFKFKNSFVTFKEVNPIILEPKEKRVVELEYTLKEYGFYDEVVEVSVDGIHFENRIQGVFNGVTGSFTAEMDDYFVISSGRYLMYFEKSNNMLILKKDSDVDVSSAVMPPEIGLPYTLELHNVKPTVEFINNNEMEITFVSNDFPNTKVILHAANYDGVGTAQYELINEGTERELRLLCNVWQNLTDAVVPYSGELLEIIGHDGSGLGDIENSKIDENWIFEKKFESGIYWEGDMRINGWKMAFESPLSTLKNGESVFAPQITLSNAHRKYEEFRKFVGYKSARPVRNYMKLNVNDGNPFYQEEYIVQFENDRKVDLKGTIEIDENISDLIDPTKSSSKNLKAKIELEDRTFAVNKKMFKTSGEIDLSVQDGVHVVRNGILDFKVDERFADSIYSLSKDGIEWLDSNYPTPSERSWWGSWIGGITYYTKGLPETVKQQESWNVEFTSVHDNFSNEWEGIKSTIRIEKEPKLKGLVIENFYLTLPGVNVLLNVTRVTNNTGKLMLHKEFERTLAVGGKKEEQFKVHIGDQVFKCWDKGIEQKTDGYVKYTSLRKDILHVFSPHSENVLPETQTEVNILWDVHRHTITDKSSATFGNMFVVIGEDLDKEALEDLANIKVEV